MKKFYCVICGNYRKFEKPKRSYLLEKTVFEKKILVTEKTFAISARMKMKNYLKKKNQLKY